MMFSPCHLPGAPVSGMCQQSTEACSQWQAASSLMPLALHGKGIQASLTLVKLGSSALDRRQSAMASGQAFSAW